MNGGAPNFSPPSGQVESTAPAAAETVTDHDPARSCGMCNCACPCVCGCPSCGCDPRPVCRYCDRIPECAHVCDNCRSDAAAEHHLAGMS